MGFRIVREHHSYPAYPKLYVVPDDEDAEAEAGERVDWILRLELIEESMRLGARMVGLGMAAVAFALAFFVVVTVFPPGPDPVAYALVGVGLTVLASTSAVLVLS